MYKFHTALLFTFPLPTPPPLVWEVHTSSELTGTTEMKLQVCSEHFSKRCHGDLQTVDPQGDQCNILREPEQDKEMTPIAKGNMKYIFLKAYV